MAGRRRKKNQNNTQGSPLPSSGSTSGNSGAGSGPGSGSSTNRSVGTVKPSRTTPYQGLPFAPYNFIPIGKEVMAYQGDVPSHRDVIKKNGTEDEKGELFSGEVTYRVTATREISVGGSTDENGVTAFYCNSENKYAIPGSTMRGLIRSNAQILSNSYVGDDIDLDSRFMYRDVAGTSKYSMRKEYENILGSTSKDIDGSHTGVLGNVRCGYIENIDGHYFLYGTTNDDSYGKKNPANYYVIRESSIHEKHNAHVQDRSKPDDFGWLFTNSPYRLQYLEGAVQLNAGSEGDGDEDSSENYDSSNDKKGGQMDPKYVNPEYRPFCIPIAYDLRTDKGGKRQVSCIKDPAKAGKPGSENLKSGYLLGSGFVEGKKALYVIPEIDDNKEKRIQVPDEDVRIYQADLKRKESILKSEKNGNVYDFYALPAEGEDRKPVFYICLSDISQGKKDNSEAKERYYLGFTPRLRIFYNNTVGGGFHQKRPRMDYAKALFGYTRKEKPKGEIKDTKIVLDEPLEYQESRKTRLSFLDAVIVDKKSPKSMQRAYVLSSPKPTSYLDYIEQKMEVEDSEGDDVAQNNKKGITSYNGFLNCDDDSVHHGDGNFSIRGIKQYWNELAVVPPTSNSESDTVSCFETLPAQTKFDGRICFHNLRGDELGLLLWSLHLGEEGEPAGGKASFNIGKAKPYGYGTIIISGIEVFIFDPEKAYATDKLNTDPYIKMEHDEQEKYITEFRKIQEESGFGKDSKAGMNRTSFMKIRKAIYPNKKDDDGNWESLYMSIDAGDYQKRKDEHAPLPTIEEVVDEIFHGGKA